MPGVLDSAEYVLARYRAVTPAFGFRARTATATGRWQRALRAVVTRRLGGFPARGPLRLRMLGTRVFPAYTRIAVRYTSRPGLDVFGYWLVPRNVRSRGPAVLALHGHGRGVGPIVGMDAKGRMRPFGRWGEYHRDYALQCVAHGYAVLAIDQFGFGSRRSAQARRDGVEASSCQTAAGAALLLGETMIGWRVWDAIRAIDWLRTRPEVDPDRIAVLGLSGGGTTSLFTAALDTRVAAAVVSGYFNTFRDSILSVPHCIDNFVPGLLHDAEQYDIAGLIAPRPLFVESGTRDPIFPVAATRAAYVKVAKVYRVLGARDRLGIEIFRDEHVFRGRAVWPFLARHL